MRRRVRALLHTCLICCCVAFPHARGRATRPQAPPLCAEAAAGHFGFPVDNTIGGTPQRNGWSEGTGAVGWVAFFRDRRLRPQLALTREPSLQRRGDALCERLPALFESVPDEQLRPAILHGDLWSGNVAAHGDEGAPVVFDPASYYGHAEADFGMSWCASFGPAFYAAYHEVIPRVRARTHTAAPLPLTLSALCIYPCICRRRSASSLRQAPGFEARAQLYQLYHYLNHYNMFGGGYYDSALRLLTQLTQ
jgi:fructosamine-3-kinase